MKSDDTKALRARAERLAKRIPCNAVDGVMLEIVSDGRVRARVWHTTNADRYDVIDIDAFGPTESAALRALIRTLERLLRKRIKADAKVLEKR